MNFFRKGLEDSITLPQHPSNEDEIQEVRDTMNKRTPKDVESIRNHDQEPFYAIRKYCEKNGLIFHDGEFDDLISQATPIIGHFKKLFDRDRPVEVDPNLNTMPSKTNKTRSYPSGHACQSRLVARYVEGKFPEHGEGLLKAGNECGWGRVQAGFHYPSDYHIGNLLGEKMFIFMNREDYGRS
jgi:hypothetical protein